MTIQSKKDYTKTPAGQYKYWDDELRASQDMLKHWHKKADKIVRKYEGKKDLQSADPTSEFRLNLFHSNVETVGSMLYGNLPKIDVSRRYADSNDDVGRVAAETMERLLNLDLQENGRELDSVLRSTLFDRLVSGLGCARVRYEADIVDEEVEGVMQKVMKSESAPIDYFFWGDVLWSWARNFADVRWIAFRNYLTKDEVSARFGEKIAEKVALKPQKVANIDEGQRDADSDGAWEKAEIWEIWDKENKKVVWFAFGTDRILDVKADPLGLNGFFPVPPFFLANPTTSLYVPLPDYTLAQDLYTQIDLLMERIVVITEAVKVVGVYDSSSLSIQQMFKQGLDNDLIPVDNWALFGEKGGLKGQIDWVPIQDIVNALDKLRELLQETIGLLQQVTGMSDIMRGELGGQYEGVGQSQMKMKMGSIRVQALQDQFAQFASDLMQIKAEVIAKHFNPETIAKKSNMQHSFDAELLPQAVQLIKNPAEARLRVSIRPESVAMVDYAQLKDERTGFLNALATFLQSSAPLMEASPEAEPFLLQLLQWGLAGFKGSSEIEGVIDRAIEASKQKSQDKKPSPEEQKMQQMQQLEQMKAQIEMQKIQAKAQADMQVRDQDREADIETAMASHQAKIAEINAGMQAKLAEIEAKMRSDIATEQASSQVDALQTAAAAESEMVKDQAQAQLDMQKSVAQTALKINEIEVSSAAKIAEAKAKPTGDKTDG